MGISDAINMTDVPLIQRTIAADGTLLKPSKPLTTIDSSIAALGATDKVNMLFYTIVYGLLGGNGS